MSKCPLILVPAYGAKYETAEDAVQAFQTGKDFKILLGPYTSIRDLDTLVEDFGKVYIKWYWEGLYVEVTNCT